MTNRLRFNPFTGTFDLLGANSSSGGGGTVTQAPKLIVDFDTAAETQIRDLVRVSGYNFVSKIETNQSTEIPNGVFGICVGKPLATTASVLFVGVVEGFSGAAFDPGEPLFVDTDGTPVHGVPASGMIQQIGFAIGPEALFFNLLQAIRRG